jgi:putative transposase
MRYAVRTVLATKPFHIDAWVTLPDHLHAIWTLPENDVTFSSRGQSIKTAFLADWPHSSFHKAVANRFHPANWTGTAIELRVTVEVYNCQR